MIPIAPYDGRTVFRRDHSVIGVFLHQDSIRNGNAERAPASALANNSGANIGRLNFSANRITRSAFR
jgi:sulfur relay (sulfurtransferase) complex TusBCD TusD component (DsrE family)